MSLLKVKPFIIDSTADYTVGGLTAANTTVGNLVVTTSIIPASNNVIDLGSPTHRFGTMYLAGNTIVLGNAAIYTDANGKIVLSSFAGNLDLNSNTVTFLNSVAANTTPEGDVVISGNLTVLGNTTTIHTETLQVQDKQITIAFGASNAIAADNAGIYVDGAGAEIAYRANTDRWEFNTGVIVDGLYTDHYYFANGAPFTATAAGSALLNNLTVTGNVDLKGGTVGNVGSPLLSNDVATKGYVDSALSGVSSTGISDGDSSISVVDTGTGNIIVAVDNGDRAWFTASGIYSTGYYYSNGAAFVGGSGGGVGYTGSRGTTGYTGSAGAGYTGSKGYTGSQGLPGNSIAVTSSVTAPSLPNVGDIWYNTTTDITYQYTYDGSAYYWLDITGATVAGVGYTGSRGSTGYTGSAGIGGGLSSTSYGIATLFGSGY